MEKLDRYGLSAQYSFTVAPGAFEAMDRVVGSLRAVEQAIESANTASRGGNLGRDLSNQARQADRGLRETTRQLGGSREPIAKPAIAYEI